MEPDHEACYRALSTRDARFDGRFFIAVRTTRIYCRPICPARTPKRENVTFFITATAAQEAGYRPCLRCRPESSPDLGAWRGTSNTVSRALTLIGEGALDGEAVDALAEAGRWRASASAPLPAASWGLADRCCSDAARSLREAVDYRDDHAHSGGRLGCGI